MNEINIELLVEKYSNMVLQIAYQNVLNGSDAEDITQEVFIKLINNIEKLQTEEHIKAWLIRVTINLSKDYNKSFWHRKIQDIDENTMYFDNENDNYIMEQIANLKPVYRNIVYLYYYQGYKINEISEILKMKQNTVSSNLTRARQSLKGLLEDGGEIYE